MKISDFMDYGEAMLRLESGDIVKLPEWAGCWYKGPDGNTLVQTRTGETTNTPYPDYQNRTDWFVTDGRRSWPEIQHAVDAGCMIRRAAWRDDCCVFHRPDNVLSIETVKRLAPIPDRVREMLVAENREIMFTGYYCKWNGYQVLNAWVPGMDDISAQDWEIVM